MVIRKNQLKKKIPKILITGNSGYIGSHLSKILKDDYSIFGLDICDPIIVAKKHYCINIINDLSIQEEFDCVIHLAGKVSVNESVTNPILYYRTNVEGTINVLTKIKTKSFILASTGSAEYLNNPYAISKKMAEDVTIQYCRTNQIPYTIFRFYNVIGRDCRDPTNPDGLLWNLISAKTSGIFKLYGTDYDTKDGTAVRDYVHVNEICYSIKKAIDNHSNKIENLGHGIGYTVREIVDLFKKVNKCEFDVISYNRREGDLEESVLKDISKYMTKLYGIERYLYTP